LPQFSPYVQSRNLFSHLPHGTFPPSSPPAFKGVSPISYPSNVFFRAPALKLFFVFAGAVVLQFFFFFFYTFVFKPSPPPKLPLQVGAPETPLSLLTPLFFFLQMLLSFLFTLTAPSMPFFSTLFPFWSPRFYPPESPPLSSFCFLICTSLLKTPVFHGYPPIVRKALFCLLLTFFWICKQAFLFLKFLFLSICSKFHYPPTPAPG